MSTSIIVLFWTGALYLPGPANIAKAGVEYPKYEVGTSYGLGFITFPWKQVPCRYRLKIGPSSNKITVVGTEKSRTADESFLFLEGEIAKGMRE